MKFVIESFKTCQSALYSILADITLPWGSWPTLGFSVQRQLVHDQRFTWKQLQSVTSYLKCSSPGYLNFQFWQILVADPKCADLGRIRCSSGSIATAPMMGQFKNVCQGVSSTPAGSCLCWTGIFGTRFNVKINVESTPSLLELWNDWVLARPANYKLDFLVNFALVEMLGPFPVNFRIDLGIYDRLLLKEREGKLDQKLWLIKTQQF